MDQSSENLNKEEPSSGQFDYSGLVPPESMGGSSAPEAPEPASQPQAPAPMNQPPPASAPEPTSPPPPPLPSPEPTPQPAPPPPPPPPIPQTPSPDSLAFPQQNQNDDLDLDAPRQVSAAGGPMPHHSSLGSWVLVIILTVLLGLAILVFLSWKGYVSIGMLNKFWGTSPTPTPVVSESSTPTAQSNDALRKKDLATISQTLKKYYTDNTAYPLSAVVIKTSDSQSVLAQALVPAYIPSLPDDPLAPSYYYGYKSDGKSFELSAVLEDKTDVSGSLQGSLNIYKVTGSTGQ